MLFLISRSIPCNELRITLSRHQEPPQWAVRLVANVEAEWDLTLFNSIHSLTLELELSNRRLNCAWIDYINYSVWAMTSHHRESSSREKVRCSLRPLFKGHVSITNMLYYKLEAIMESSQISKQPRTPANATLA
jgi:hypothetical protein